MIWETGFYIFLFTIIGIFLLEDDDDIFRTTKQVDFIDALVLFTERIVALAIFLFIEGFIYQKQVFTQETPFQVVTIFLPIQLITLPSLIYAILSMIAAMKAWKNFKSWMKTRELNVQTSKKFQ